MSVLNKVVSVWAAALTSSFALAGIAFADAPTACGTYKPAANSTVIGKSWVLSQRDDGQDWSKSTWTLVFTADGKWTQDGKAAGEWCQDGELLIFGFDDAPHTVYRGQIGVVTTTGFEAWDGAGTGIFEMTVVK